jgi:hypothetical protein
MTDRTANASPAAARTRLLLEGPIVPPCCGSRRPNLVVNVVLIAVTPASTRTSSASSGSMPGRPVAGLPAMMLMAADGQLPHGRRHRRLVSRRSAPAVATMRRRWWSMPW